ncbi:hypothetical protein QTP88_019428 [Uroleucon formosanum]
MDKWIVKTPKLDVKNRDQHDRDHNNKSNYEKLEINEISSSEAITARKPALVSFEVTGGSSDHSSSSLTSSSSVFFKILSSLKEPQIAKSSSIAINSSMITAQLEQSIPALIVNF